MKKIELLNDELIRLLDKHKLRPVRLAKNIGSSPSLIYDLKSKRRTLGEELFIKILRKGFRYSEKEIRKVFINAVGKKYLSRQE